MTHLEDSEIISLFYERSEQAIAELERKYGAAVRKTAANILDSIKSVRVSRGYSIEIEFNVSFDEFKNLKASGNMSA